MLIKSSVLFALRVNSFSEVGQKKACPDGKHTCVLAFSRARKQCSWTSSLVRIHRMYVTLLNAFMAFLKQNMKKMSRLASFHLFLAHRDHHSVFFGEPVASAVAGQHEGGGAHAGQRHAAVAHEGHPPTEEVWPAYALCDQPWPKRRALCSYAVWFQITFHKYD